MNTLRDSLHDNIFNCGRPAKQIADEIGISYSYLASAGNPNLEEFHFQLKHLIPLSKSSNCFDTLDYIEKALGRVAFTVPSIGPDVSAVATEVAAVTLEFSHLMKELSEALADGVVESQEWPSLARECDHLINKVCRLREAAKQEAAKQ
jgi:regulator of replication initiation timing